LSGCSNLYCYVRQVLREESTEATGAEEAETAAPLAAAADTSAVAREEPAQQEADTSAGGRENYSEGSSFIHKYMTRLCYIFSMAFGPFYKTLCELLNLIIHRRPSISLKGIPGTDLVHFVLFRKGSDSEPEPYPGPLRSGLGFQFLLDPDPEIL
jgi:hypothetical protein